MGSRGHAVPTAQCLIGYGGHVVPAPQCLMGSRGLVVSAAQCFMGSRGHGLSAPQCCMGSSGVVPDAWGHVVSAAQCLWVPGDMWYQRLNVFWVATFKIEAQRPLKSTENHKTCDRSCFGRALGQRLTKNSQESERRTKTWRRCWRHFGDYMPK